MKDKLFAPLVSLVLVVIVLVPLASLVSAGSVYQSLPFSQAWTDTGLITTNDNWSGVPGILGYLGDYTASSPTAVDPQTLLADYSSTAIDVIANQANPDTNNTGGVAEFEITNPVVAFQGSGTADAPYLLIHIDTTGKKDIVVSYNLRDIDGSGDNAIQPVALHYRVGGSGNFTNVPAAFVADATTGPSLATLVTPVSVILPAAADNQALLQLRIMTTNAVGSDEWVGIDDISITASPLAVTLADFTAHQVDDHVLVAWETVSELDNVGFNLYRSDDAAGPQTLLAYLPSQAPGSAQGFAYSYEDLAVQPGQTVWYWLEDVSLSGATTLHGPVSATVQAPTAVTLASVSASPTAGVAALPWLVGVAGAGVALALRRRR